MRTLHEILTDLKDGKLVDDEESRYAALALDQLLVVALNVMGRVESSVVAPAFSAVLRASTSCPKHWLGWDRDPENPDFQARRASARRATTLH